MDSDPARNLFVDFINFNEMPDYALILTLFCSYLALLWLIISVWVSVDAWKRFSDKKIAVLFGILVFVLNFPVLIFYFIIRPESKYEELEEWESGGVSVPLVNFTGKNGVEMVLEIKMNPANLVPSASDMKVDVSWDSRKENFELKPLEEQEVKKSDDKHKYDKKIRQRGHRQVSNIFSSWGGLVRKRIDKVKEMATEKTKDPEKIETRKKESKTKDLANKKSQEVKPNKKKQKKNKKKAAKSKKRKNKK